MIPLILLSYNQPTYLLNAITWFRWYYPTNPIYILDNFSDNPKVFEVIDFCREFYHVNDLRYKINDCAGNLAKVIDLHIKDKYEYYAISDVDIMPAPDTPSNFLEIFKQAIDSGYHRAGFDLITEDLPDWLHNKATVIENENLAGQELTSISVEGKLHNGRRAAIDTTFCLYTTKNTGWHQPFNGSDWGNALRVLKARHLGWYIDQVPEEMKHYYNSCIRHDGTTPPAGRNNYRPKEFL